MNRPPERRLPPAAAQLLALDWGTSSLRAFLMNDGQIVEARHSGHGIQHLPAPGEAGFRQAFAHIAGDWLRQWPIIPSVACGMVGSAQGWREAPYAPCPAALSALAAHGAAVDHGLSGTLLIAPGVAFDAPEAMPDVMRGEEIQIAGALSSHSEWNARAVFLLPGTHSKWVRVDGGRIERFSTYLTGELFAVLCRHSILGRLMPEEAAATTDAHAFEWGLATAREAAPGDFTHQIFAARTLGLCGRLAHAALADFLSGLLIGHELLSALARLPEPAPPLILIGEAALCRRYARALEAFGRPPNAVLENTAPAGLWRFARDAGLISSGVS